MTDDGAFDVDAPPVDLDRADGEPKVVPFIVADYEQLRNLFR